MNSGSRNSQTCFESSSSIAPRAKLVNIDRPSPSGTLAVTLSQSNSNQRRGLSLLEVILSIAILGGSMVVIGHLYNLGFRSAQNAQFRSEANRLADSKMAELAAGVIPAESTSDAEIEDAPGWQYSIEIEDSLQPGLFLATVFVKRESESDILADGLSIVRFIPDPDYDAEEDQE